MNKKNQYTDSVKETLILTLAVAIIAAAVYFFLVPSHASVSSISGLGIILALIMVTVTGCDYTLEEKREMKRYEKQGRENAKNYIREKYGIDAKITEINCEKYSSSPVPDFFPAPTGNVFVKMKYKGADFLVAISGQKKNTDGLDNYQFQEIATAFAQEMYNITGLHAESAYVCYGEYGTVKDEKNGMIHTFYDGENLAEVLQKESARAVVSYANQDVEQIPVSQISQKTGVDTILLTDYESREAYQTVRCPYYNLAGWPIENGIENQLYLMNGYRVVGAGEDTYVKCEKKIQDDIILITENPKDQIILEKTSLDSQENWNGNGFIDAKQVASAYAFDTNSEKVYVYFPVEKLDTKEVKEAQLVKQYQYKGETCYDNIISKVTDDGKYIHGIVYTRDETEIKISVFIDK